MKNKNVLVIRKIYPPRFESFIQDLELTSKPYAEKILEISRKEATRAENEGWINDMINTCQPYINRILRRGRDKDLENILYIAYMEYLIDCCYLYFHDTVFNRLSDFVSKYHPEFELSNSELMEFSETVLPTDNHPAIRQKFLNWMRNKS